MYPFEYPHNRYQSNPHNRSRGECPCPRNHSIMPKRNEDDQHLSSHFDHQPYSSNYNHPPYYQYGAPSHLSYVQPPPPSPLPPCYYAHYYPPYPAHFIPPPPPSPCNYSMDYHHHPYHVDYYNHNNKTHCCGCTNHTCQPGNDASPSLRIQEEPFHQSEARESNDVVPPSNYAPPIVWRLPSSDSIKANDNDGNKYDEKASEKDEVGKMSLQSPSYPVIWLPCNSGFEEKTGDKNATASKSAQEWPSNLKFVPLNFLENGGDDEPESEVNKVALPVDKKSNTKTVPVKQVDDRSSFVADKGEGNIGKMVEAVGRTQPSNVKIVPLNSFGSGDNTQQKTRDPVEKKEIKTKTIPVKHIYEKSSEKSCDVSSDKDKKENKLDGKVASTMNDTLGKKKPSTTKSSKLPPICLRVGPRPKKTSANSSGTSKPTIPSTTSSKTNKERNEKPSGEKIIPANTVKECNQNEHVIPINIVKDNNLGQGKKEQVCEENMTIAPPEKNTSSDDSSKTSEVTSQGSNIENHEKTGMEDPATTSELKMNVDEEKVEEPIKKMNEKKLSETDAATIIQSAYRGFVVRRWHPLEKLKKIAKIREETNEVRRQVDDIEACPTSQLDAKKKVVLGETIMNLLLQLDMIQGLHPSVKEVRKSLANKLTCLEDKLESIYTRIAMEHGSSKLDEIEADTLQCESNFVSFDPESMDGKITTSDAELKTKSDISLDSSFSAAAAAADVTSSTPVCEVAREHDVQVYKDNATKDHGIIQEESSECESNFVSSAPESMDDKNTFSNAEPQPKSDIGLDFSPSGDDGAADDTPTTLVCEAACDHDVQVDDDNVIKEREVIQEVKSPSYKERVDEEEIGEDATQPSFEPISMSADAREHDGWVNDDNDMEEHEIIEEVKLPYNEERVQEEEINEEEEEKDNSAETRSIVNIASADALEEDDAEPNSIASDGLPAAEARLPQNCTSVESMEVERESSIVIGNDSEKQDSMLEDGYRNKVPAKDDKQSVCNELEVSEEDADIKGGRKVDDDYVEGDEKDIKGDVMKEKEMRLFEENDKLRKMVEELVQSGNKQLNVITNLNERVKDLEKKLQLTKKKRMKVRRSKAAKNHTGEVGGN